MRPSIRIKKGLDIPLAGKPRQEIDEGPAIRHVALCGPDYVGLKPRMLVSEGDEVRLGQPLLEDKRDPEIRYVSPGSGTVSVINRGPRRVLESVVVRLSESGTEDVGFDPLSGRELEMLERDRAVARLLESGLWTSFRTRPFSRLPRSDSVPRSIFVTATDTRPLAADPAVVARMEPGTFISGLRVLSRLTAGPVWLCAGAGWDIEVPEIERLRTVAFSGPHPAGLPGTHIHHLDPVGPGREVWQVGCQDVMAIGRLFVSGRNDMKRIVALGGESIGNPRLVSTRLGASVSELMENEVRDAGGARILSGSVLDGRTASGGLAYLGRYHGQVSVIPEGGERRLLGWSGLFQRAFTAASPTRRGRIRKRQPFTTSQHGRFSGMIPLRVFEKVMPLDILPSPLFRALLVRDTDRAQELGCLELDEEDLALSSFVCPAKTDYGAALRINLDQIEKEG